MKTNRTTNSTSRFLERQFIARIALIVALAALVVVPLFSSSLASSSKKDPQPDAFGAGLPKKAVGIRSLLPALMDESIATFAADCETPKTAFVLGETVCAKTDDVDLMGNRHVNWITPSLTVAHGGDGVTDITANPQFFSYAPTVVGTWKVSIATLSDISETPAIFTVSPPPPIQTLAAGCLIPKETFDLGDDACARINGNLGFSRRVAWVDPASYIRQVTPITTDPQNDTFSIPTTTTSMLSSGVIVKNVGKWRVIILSSRGSLVASLSFTVRDPAENTADLAITKSISPFNEQVPAGSSSTFEITVTNNGPDTATSVVLTDVVPANTTFESFTQLSGPTFLCPTNPSPGGTGTVTCTLASLPRGGSASFDFAFTVNTGTAAGTLIPNTATISSATTELDSNDNSATATASVTAAAAGGCTLDCPNNITVTANTTQSGNPGAIVTYAPPDTNGSCGAITMSQDSGTFFPVGSTTVVATAGSASCSFIVTVRAATTITCPANITVTANEGETTAFVPDPGGSSSDPGTPTTTGTGVIVVGERSDEEPLTAAYPVGVTTILWTATDNTGNSESCAQTITVNTNTPLTITCPADITVTAPTGECEATVDPGTATASPSSATVAGERSDHLPLTDPYPSGTTVITWTATATDGRTRSCTQNITVNANDTTPPTLTVPPDINVTTNTCSAILDDELGTASATDNCSSVTISRSGVPLIACPTPAEPGRMCESFNFPVGTTIVTYTATDAANNVTTGIQHVTVHENTTPTITAPANVTVNTGLGATSCGAVVSNATLGTATANDNCPGVTVVRTGVPAGNNFPVGPPTTVTYTATDASGNQAVAFQTVTVIDDTPPTVTPPAPTSTDAGSCSATIPNVVSGTIATDNCAVATVTQSPAAGTSVGLGTHTITVTVTDVNGNSSQANTTFTVNSLQFTGNVWMGLKNSDDVGTKFDLLAEVLKNGNVVGSAQINDLPGGSSGFNNAILRTVNGALSTTGFCTGDTLGLRLSVRVAASSGHVSGTARLWYGDSAANSRFIRTVNGVNTTYYLRNISNNLVLDPGTGTTKFTSDVLVNRNQNGNPFKPFGTWNLTF